MKIAELFKLITIISLKIRHYNKFRKEKRVEKGLIGKNTDKPLSILFPAKPRIVKGRVVFSAKNTENLHPKPLAMLVDAIFFADVGR